MWSIESIPDLTGRTAVITGANSGIGLPTALELARRGARTILATRSEAKGTSAVRQITDQAPDAQVEWRELDLADLDSVRRFGAEFGAAYDSLDILIANAGLGFQSKDVTKDGFERVFGTNHLGHFALTARLFGRLVRRPDARVVVVSSDSHESAHLDFDDLQSLGRFGRVKAYGRSKLANLLFAIELHRRATKAGLDLRSIAVHPGFTATNIAGGNPVVRWIMDRVAQPALFGALPSLYAATSDEVNSGAYIVPGRRGATPVEQRAKPQAYDEDDAARLWSMSEELTGVPFDVESFKD